MASIPGDQDPALDAIALKIRDQSVAPDVAVGVASRDSKGWAIRTGGAKTRAFDLASVTKPMTAVACVEAGILPHARLRDLVPELAGTASAEMTLELLLSHRAGLEAHVPLHLGVMNGELSKAEALLFAANARRADANGEMREHGYAPVYSDLGYILAGTMLARAAGTEDAGDAVEKLIIAPWGLDGLLGTAESLRAQGLEFVPTEDAPWRGGIVCGEVHDENAWILTGSGGSGHAGMFGTVEGVLKFGMRVLDGQDRYAWLLKDRPGGTLRAGFDGKSEQGSSAGARISAEAFGHLGFTGTSLWIDPEHELVLSLLTNRVHPTRNNIRIKEARPWVHDALWEIGFTDRSRS